MIISESKSLYSDIDNCISELLKARTEHNSENEGKALFKMEGLMVSTLQHLSCIIEQPSAPANLDEAAKEYNRNLVPFDQCDSRDIRNAFKAGAEWVARQDKSIVYLENYISNKLRDLGADLINHKPYSFNRGLNVGKTSAYDDILHILNAGKK